MKLNKLASLFFRCNLSNIHLPLLLWERYWQKLTTLRKAVAFNRAEDYKNKDLRKNILLSMLKTRMFSNCKGLWKN